MTVVGCPLSQPPGSVEQPELEEQPLDSDAVEDVRADPVRRQQVDPRQHPHQVVDPERKDQGEQDRPLPAPGVPRREVRDRVSDQQREGHRDRDELDRSQRDGPERPAVQEVVEHVDDVADVPVERVPVRDRLRQRVLVAERDGQHRVERAQEEDREPDDAREGHQAPGPARAHQPALNFDQASSQKRWPVTLSWSSSWLAANWSGPHDRLLEGLRDQALLDQRLGVDPVLRRRVAGEVDEVVVGVLLVEHEVDERVREHGSLRRPPDAEEVVLDDAVLVRPPERQHVGLDALRQVVEGRREQVPRPRLVQHRLALGQRLVVGDRDLRVADAAELGEVALRPC